VALRKAIEVDHLINLILQEILVAAGVETAITEGETRSMTEDVPIIIIGATTITTEAAGMVAKDTTTMVGGVTMTEDRHHHVTMTDDSMTAAIDGTKMTASLRNWDDASPC
jgi:hypothetical protein